MSWYTGSLYDRTVFNYLRNKKGWEETKIQKLAKAIAITGPIIIIIGVVLVVSGI